MVAGRYVVAVALGFSAAAVAFVIPIYQTHKHNLEMFQDNESLFKLNNILKMDLEEKTRHNKELNNLVQDLLTNASTCVDSYSARVKDLKETTEYLTKLNIDTKNDFKLLKETTEYLTKLNIDTENDFKLLKETNVRIIDNLRAEIDSIKASCLGEISKDPLQEKNISSQFGN